MKNRKQIVYIIEDNIFFSKLLEEKILMQGIYETCVFNTGEEALANADFNADIVILDYFLSIKDDSIMNGLEITKKLRQKKPNIPIIILSGQEKIDIAVELLNKGACDYIEKNDYAVENVINSLQKITALQKAHQEIHMLRKKSAKDKLRMSLIFTSILISLAAAFWYYQ